GAIESREFKRPAVGVIFADLIDALLEHRKVIRRPLGKTAAFVISRLKDQHGLEPADALTEAFWRKHALSRMAGVKSIGGGAPVTSQTAAQDLLYASVVVRHASDSGINVDRDAPARARAKLRDNDNLRLTSRPRMGRISDAELAALLGWIDANAARTHVPLGDIVRFALATAMRRGEILNIKHEDLQERVVLVRNRKHPRDHERVDQVPLLQKNAQWPRDDPLEIIQRQPTKTGRVFPYQGDTIGFWFEAAVTGAGIKGNVVFHLLRHEALSRYAERGMDLLRLQLIGGHRDIRHLQRYVKLDAKALANE
ncbi:MAG TPA: tyrosine-type recombinase/integrase, partial [Candidatus Eremiobacteraceae bacterium]|nr:tyrosine-type recombinase/integrase [Candidatus Eremiobacteraceae bacterium]